VTGPAEKITELAISDTDVGSIHIPVYLPGHFTMRDLFFPQFISNEHKICQRGMMVKKHSFFHGEKTEPRSFFEKTM